LAAPLFVFLHNFLFQQKLFDLELISFDIKALFFLIIFYPVIEELVFRGVIQEFIASKTKQFRSFFHLSIANVMTSLLFVAIHFVHHPPSWALLVFIPSLIFGYFKEQYGDIRASIMLHMFYNTCSLFLIL
jgi:membrane protease YdiL (CAAX protease family)